MRASDELASCFLLGFAVLAGGCGPKEGEMAPPQEPAFTTHANAKDASGEPDRHPGAPSESRVDRVGLASWYGAALAGRRTSSGERFDPKLYTAAHKTLPFGTWVEVRRIDTGRTVRVRINDRGPNGRAAHRLIDLSQRAAEDLDLVRAGVVRVELRVVSGP